MDISLLEIIAWLFTIGAGIAGFIIYVSTKRKDEWTDDSKPHQPHPRVVIGGTGAAMLVIVLISVIIGHLGAGTPPGQKVIHFGSTSITPTPTNASTATAIPTATSAPVPTSIPDATYGTQNIAPNWQLDCGGCDQPVIITVSLVATSASNQNMVWALSFQNHTADNMQVYFSDLRLVDQADPDPNNHIHSATGAAMQYPGTSIASGRTAQIQATFAFLPKHQETYTLTAELHFSDETNAGFGYRDYGPQSLTFP